MLLTSEEWERLIPIKYKLQVLSPDGWDRKNYNYSYKEELISKEEFMRRLSNSTIECSVNFFNEGWE